MKTQRLNSTSDTHSKLSPVVVSAATTAADLTDPHLKQIAAMPADRLAQRLMPDMLVEIPKRIGISNFAAAEVSVDVVDIHPLPDQVYVCFDFHLREKLTEACRKGRIIDGEATLIFLPERKALLDVNYAEEVQNDSGAVAASPLPVSPTFPN